MVSVKIQIEKCEALIGTSDISDWETEFLKNIVPKAKAQFRLKLASGLSAKQLEILERIHNKHFAG